MNGIQVYLNTQVLLFFFFKGDIRSHFGFLMARHSIFQLLSEKKERFRLVHGTDISVRSTGI